MSIAVTLALAVFPSLLLVRYFHDRDLYPEPPRIIWTTFALGAMTTIPVLLVTLPFFDVLRGIEGPYQFGFVTAFFFAALPEEFFKLAVLLGFSFRRQEFDEPMDGIVYGAVVGQGFAALENVVYSLSGGNGLAIMRSFTAVPAHACMGIVMGYFVGRARFEPENRYRLIAQGFIFAVLIHGLYDYPMMVNNAIQQFNGGTIPDEYIGVALGCLAASAIILVGSIVIGLKLVRAAHREQVAKSQGAGGVAAPPIPAVSHLEPALADVHAAQAHAAVPPPIPPHVPIREASPDMFMAFLEMAVGGVLAVFGGTMLSGGVHALFDAKSGSMAAGIVFCMLLLGAGPFSIGTRLFRRGIRELNSAHRNKAASKQ